MTIKTPIGTGWFVIAASAVLAVLTFVIQPNPASAQFETATKPSPAKVRVIANQEYAKFDDGKGLLCDIYLPDTGTPKSGFPVVVVIHGGGWVSGDKWTVEGYGRMLAKAGYATFTVNYRLAPENKFPVPLDDVRQSLIWIAESATEYSLDISRFGMFGYSAGGHLSLLTGLTTNRPFSEIAKTTMWTSDDPRWKQLPKIKAICAGGPPCEFRDLPLDNTTMSFFFGGSRREKPDTYKAASPISHVWKGCPPVQLIHGEKDLLVSISQSQAMQKKLQSAGVEVNLETVPKLGHMLTFMNRKTRQTMLAFFENKL